MKSIGNGSLARLIGEKSFTASEFVRKWGEISRREEKLKEELMRLVPDCLKGWFEEHNPLNSLVDYGRADNWKMYVGEHGFTDRADIRRKLKLLKAAWKGVVDIEWTGHDIGLVRINFRATF